ETIPTNVYDVGTSRQDVAAYARDDITTGRAEGHVKALQECGVQPLTQYSTVGASTFRGASRVRPIRMVPFTDGLAVAGRPYSNAVFVVNMLRRVVVKPDTAARLRRPTSIKTRMRRSAIDRNFRRRRKNWTFVTKSDVQLTTFDYKKDNVLVALETMTFVDKLEQ
ncbi:hypothetical protein NP493_471g00018, partial [Ridgeia piscesae]